MPAQGTVSRLHPTAFEHDNAIAETRNQRAATLDFEAVSEGVSK